jgi:hypothetical protein
MRKGRLDRHTWAVLTSADKVEVFRLDGNNFLFPDKKVSEEKETRRIGGFLVTGQGEDPEKAFAGKLAEVLADERTDTGNAKKCFQPGVAFRIWKGKEVVDVLICFGCNNLYCGPSVDLAQENTFFGRSPRRPDLVRLAKEAFPADREIQALQDEEGLNPRRRRCPRC